MNGRQRIQAALAGCFSDRVPVMLHNFMHAIAEAGGTHAGYREDPAVIAKVHIQAVERYGLDGILLDLDTVTLAGALGVPVDFPQGSPARSHKPGLSSLEAVDDLPPLPDIANYRYVQVLLEAARLLRAYFGDEIYIRGNVDQAPFSLACSLRTPGELLMDLMDESLHPRIDRLLDYCGQAGCQFIRLMAGTGVDMVSSGDSPAGPAMISPKQYRRFALPGEQQLAAAARTAGLPWLLHICGNTDLILAAMAESGAAACELDYKTDQLLIRKVITPQIAFFGNVDPTGILVRATPETVAEVTRHLLRNFRDVPRFVLNAGCAIPPSAPPENLRAMIQAAREFVR